MSTTDATAAIDAASAAISAAAAVIRNADAILVTTGAGMGVDSGLGTFRGRNAGVWAPLKALDRDFSELSCPDVFEEDERLSLVPGCALPVARPGCARPAWALPMGLGHRAAASRGCAKLRSLAYYGRPSCTRSWPSSRSSR